MNKYFDSHCHLNMMEDSKMIMEKCESLNINYCIVGTDLETSSKINKDYSSYSSSFIYSLGIHPEYADEVDRIEELDKMLESSSCKAVGECGLDYFFNKENKEKQKKLFITQIKLAIKYKLPLIIHCRDAYEDLYEILKTYHTKLSNILIHCFDTTFDWVEKFDEFDCYYAIGGKITYKKCDYLRESLKKMKHNRILTETDSPWLSPEPLRKEKNTPLNIICIVKFINELLGADLTEKIYENTLNFFNLK